MKSKYINNLSILISLISLLMLLFIMYGDTSLIGRYGPMYIWSLLVLPFLGLGLTIIGRKDKLKWFGIVLNLIAIIFCSGLALIALLLKDF